MHTEMLSNGPVARKKKEETTNAAIPTPVYRSFAAFCESRGELSLRASAGKVLNWFLAQPPPVQSAILGINDGMQSSYAEVIATILRSLDDSRPGDPSFGRPGRLEVGPPSGLIRPGLASAGQSGPSGTPAAAAGLKSRPKAARRRALERGVVRQDDDTFVEGQ